MFVGKARSIPLSGEPDACSQTLNKSGKSWQGEMSLIIKNNNDIQNN
jgi:hypothetical protein